MNPVKAGGEPHAADLLAPWRATGRLDEADVAAIDRMLAEDPSLVDRLDVALDERDATVALNEALPAPSSAMRDRLFDRIEAHEAARAPKAAGLMRWLSAKLSAASPGTLAWGAAAAALVIALQAGLLTKAYLAGGEATYQTASDGNAAATGATALVAFQPAATAEQIAALLGDAKAEIVGGPKPGGVFVVRLSAEPLEGAALDAALKRFRDDPLVRFVSPGGGAQ